MKRTWFERLAPSAIGLGFALAVALLVVVAFAGSLSHVARMLP